MNPINTQCTRAPGQRPSPHSATRTVLAWVALLLALAGCGAGQRLQPLPTGATILAFGDSLTFGTGAAPDDSYPNVLAELSGHPVRNAGVPGEVTAQGAARLTSVLMDARPALVILMHGGNDNLRRLPAHDTERHLSAMVRDIHAHGAQVMLLAMPGMNLMLTPPTHYRAVADAEQVPLDDATLPSLLSNRALKSDPVHLNAAGYRELATAIAARLRDEGALR